MEKGICDSPLVSIILVNHNTRQDLLDCLDSIKKNVHIPYEVIITDNNSHDGSVESISRKYPDVLINSLKENVGFAPANNIGVRRASGKYLLILNPDTIVPASTVDHLIKKKERNPSYGIVAPLILNEDLSFQLSFGRDMGLFTEIFFKYFAQIYYRWIYNYKKKNLDGSKHWVSGVCFLIERELFNQLNGFDDNYFIYMEDADFCRRLRRAGHAIHYTTTVSIIHRLGTTCSNIPSLILPKTKQSHLYYYSKHHGRLQMEILRIYLICRFQSKRFSSWLKCDKKSFEIYSKTLRFIKEFRGENNS